MTGYEAFCLYNSIKIHFLTPSYDFFKYNGKVTIKPNAFEKRKDKYYFYKLSRLYNRDDYINFVVSCFVCKEKVWVGDLLQEEMIQQNSNRLSVIQSLSYRFKEDCVKLKEQSSDPNELLKVVDGNYPILLTLVLQKEINIETLCICNSLMNFFPMWSNRISDTIRWPTFKQTCEKYTPFISFQKDKFTKILLSQLL